MFGQQAVSQACRLFLQHFAAACKWQSKRPNLEWTPRGHSFFWRKLPPLEENSSLQEKSQQCAVRQLGRHSGARFCSFLFSQYPNLLLHCLGCSGLTGARPERMGRAGCRFLSFPCLFFWSYFFSPLVMSCSFLLLLLGFSCPYLSLAPSLPFPSLLISCPFLSLSFPFFALPISSLGFIVLVLHSPFLFVLSCHDCSLHPVASLSFSCLSLPPLSLLFPKSFSFSILPLSLSCSCSPPRPFPCPVLSLPLPLFFGRPSPFFVLSRSFPFFPFPCLLHAGRAGAAGVQGFSCGTFIFLAFFFLSFVSFPFLVFPSLALSCLRFPPFPSLSSLPLPSLPFPWLAFALAFAFIGFGFASSLFLLFPSLPLPRPWLPDRLEQAGRDGLWLGAAGLLT